MGTRADFYIGRGPKAEWIGSIAYDGYPDGLEPELLRATNAKTFRKHVTVRLKEDDGTTPDMGWPWPWDDSHTSDYAYAYDKGHVWVTTSDDTWRRADQTPDPVEFPNMASKRKDGAPAGSTRSGIMVIGR